MRYILCCIIIACVTFCCRNAPKKQIQEYDNSKVEFYPLNQYLDSQINDVVTTPYYIYAIKTVDNKRDSFTISAAQFNLIANEFVKDDPAKQDVKKFYKENVFHDASTQSITFNYSTAHPTLSLRSTDILLDDNSQRVKRIFMLKHYARKDSIVEMKLGWIPNESLYINKSIDHQKKRYTEQLQVVWNVKKANK
jgi:hypothetical protein